jgi:serine/threonine-protein kinase
LGKQIGNYQIVEEIGRGGMAVVYKARQASLDRYVALKVLPAYLQHDGEFLARFQREAQAAAQFNHPNIVAIYDTGEADGLHYIAMEYLEGGSLEQRLAGRPIDLPEAERIVREVGSALDYAHGRGLVHRDIKPSNILFTVEGTAKVSDFGIVRAADGTRLTRTGVLLGTPEYMAPEQMEGEEVDWRADLYALGVVLYQMVTGVVPFRGTTPHAVMHAVIYEAPLPPREGNPGMSQAMEGVLLKALAKEPAERFQSGREMAEALGRARKGEMVVVPSSAWGAKPSPTRQSAQSLARQSVDRGAVPRRTMPGTVWVALAAVVAVGVVMWLVLSAGGARGEEAMATAQAQTRVAEEWVATAGAAAWHATQTAVAAATEIDAAVQLTADAMGTRMASEATQTVLAHPTDTPVPMRTPKPTSTLAPSSTDTATPVPLPPAIVFAAVPTGTEFEGGEFDIYTMDRTGGQRTRLLNHEAGVQETWPIWLPDKKRIIFCRESLEGSFLWLTNADGSDRRRLYSGSGNTYPAISPDGKQLAFVSTQNGNGDIYIADLDRTYVMQLTNHPGNDFHPDWSPDGGQIVFDSNRDGNSAIYVVGVDGSNPRSLTRQTSDTDPTWSPDGRHIAFVSFRDGNGEIYVMNADGSNQRNISNNPAHDLDVGWTPNGRIVFASARDRDFEIYVMNRDGSGLVQLTDNKVDDRFPDWK